MNELIWTKESDCPKNQFTVSDEGYQIFSGNDLFIREDDDTVAELKVNIRVMKPILLMFNQVDDFKDMALITKQLFIQPEIVAKDIAIKFIGISKERFTIRKGMHIANMVILDLKYCNLFEVSPRHFGNYNV